MTGRRQKLQPMGMSARPEKVDPVEVGRVVWDDQKWNDDAPLGLPVDVRVR